MATFQLNVPATQLTTKNNEQRRRNCKWVGVGGGVRQSTSLLYAKVYKSNFQSYL